MVLTFEPQKCACGERKALGPYRHAAERGRTSGLRSTRLLITLLKWA